MSMGAAPRLQFVGSRAAWIKAAAKKKAAAAPAAAPVAIRDQSPDTGSEVHWRRRRRSRSRSRSQVSQSVAAAAAADQSPDPERSLMDWARVPEVEWQHIDELLDVSPQAEAVQSGSSSVAATTTTTAVVEP
jgi:hypothetical protein